MKFKICLTNSIFAPDYSNARHFESRSEQESYFHVNELFTTDVPERNVNFGTLVNIQLNVKTGEVGIGDIMSSNYAIIKELATGKFYYYFITNSTFDSANQVRLDLTIDVIQTYYLDMTFGDAIIERACLNRFDNEKISKSIDSPFLMRDEIQGLSQRIKTITHAKVSPFSIDSSATNWINDNILAWVYAYLDAGEYTYGEQTFSTQMRYIAGDNQLDPSIKSPYVVVVAPLMKNQFLQDRFAISGTLSLNDAKRLRIANFNSFIEANKAHVYAIKLSLISPFSINSLYDISAEAIPTLCVYNTRESVEVIGDSNAICVVKTQYLQPQNVSKNYRLPQSDIIKSNILDYADDLQANPKSFNSDYRNLKISFCGNEYSFDIQKLYASSALDSDSINLKYLEILTPEIGPSYITIDGVEGALYNEAFLNKIGYLAQNDLSIPYSKNQLDVFLANNKNFFAQKQAQYTQMRASRAISGINNALSGAIGTAGAAVAGDVGSAIKTGVGSVLGIFESAIQNEFAIDYDETTTKYTLDNMQAGVDALANSNSNPFFNLAVSNLEILIEETEALNIDFVRALEDMHENGYSYNRMGDIKDYDNIRRNWNYIRAKVEIIKTPAKIPNEVRNIVKAIFARGIRFWNTDNITYHQTNLER